MSIVTMLQHSCAIKRKQTVGTNGRSSVQQLYSGVSSLFLPMNHRTAIENNFSIGRAYDVYFNAGQDIQPGDQLVYNGSTFSVRSVQNYNVPIVGYICAQTEQEVDPA